MTSKQSMFVLIVGLIMTMGAVGGIEMATDEQLLSCMMFAIVGLLTMLCGTLGMKTAAYYDER
jgi:uncharacterized membrane protein